MLHAAVSERAVVRRINRKLKPKWEVIKKCRPAGRSSLGDYYRLDVYYNRVLDYRFDLEQLARELGGLRPYEEMARG